MANIISYLPPSSRVRKKYQADVERTEKAFNLKPGTIERANEIAQEKKKSKSSSKKSSTKVVTPQNVFQQTTVTPQNVFQPQVDEAKRKAELVRIQAEKIRRENIERINRLQRMRTQRIFNVVDSKKTITPFLPENLRTKIEDRDRLVGLRPGMTRIATQSEYDSYFKELEKEEAKSQKRVQEITKKIDKTVDEIKKIESKDIITFNDRKYLDVLKMRLNNLRKDISRGVTTGEVTRADLSEEKELVGKLLTRKLRGKGGQRGEIELVALGFGTAVLDNIRAIRYAPQTISYLVRNPSAILQIPAGLVLAGKEFGEVLRINPSYAFGKIGGEILFLYTAGKSIKVVGKVSKGLSSKLKRVQFSKLDNKYKLVSTNSKNKIVLKSVAQIKKRVAKVRRKEMLRSKADMRNLDELTIEARKVEVDRVTKQLADKFERSQGIKLDRALRGKLEDSIKNKLNSQIDILPSQLTTNVASKFVKKGFLKSTFKQIRSFASSFSKKGRKMKRIKKIKLKKKERILDRELDIMRSQSKKEYVKSVNKLTKKLADKFEDVNGVRFDKAGRKNLENTIRDKINSRLVGSRKTVSNVRRLSKPSLVKNVFSSVGKRVRRTVRRIKREVSLKASKQRRLKKIKKTKQSKLEDIRREIREKEYFKSKREDTVNKLVKKYEDSSGTRFDSSTRELVKDAIRKRLKAGLSQKKIQSILKYKAPKSISKRVNKIRKSGTVRQGSQLGRRTNKRIKTIRDFQTRGSDGKFIEASAGGGQKQVLLQRTKQVMKQKSRLRTKKKFKSRQLQDVKSKQTKPSESRTVQQTLSRKTQSVLIGLLGIKLLQQLRQGMLTQQQVMQVQKQVSRMIQKQGSGQSSKQDSAQVSDQLSKLASGQQINQDSLTRTLQKYKTKTKLLTETKKMLKKLRLRPTFGKEKMRLSTTLQTFDVYAKPVKRSKMDKVNRLVRVNKSPLSRQRAEDLRNYIVDTSLSRTAILKPSGLTSYKGGGVDISRIPVGYASKTNKKFRGYRIVKGKKVKLKNTRIIEKTPFIVDTTGERKGISLRRRIQQLSGKRKVYRRPLNTKLATQRLINLKKARAKLKRLRARRR